jgi:hypothetical protein
MPPARLQHTFAPKTSQLDIARRPLCNGQLIARQGRTGPYAQFLLTRPAEYGFQGRAFLSVQPEVAWTSFAMRWATNFSARAPSIP